MNRGRHTQSGFTLIEVLVAVSMLAIVGIMGYRGLDGIRSASETIAGGARSFQQLSTTLDRLRRDIGQTIVAANGTALTGTPPLAEGCEVTFLRALNDELPPRWVTYRWQAANGALMLAEWSGNESKVRYHLLLEGVRSLEFSYLHPNGRWSVAWPVAGAVLPRAVRVKLVVDDLGSFERVFDVPTAD